MLRPPPSTPHTEPITTDPASLVDRLLTRNAGLIVALRHAIATVHRTAPGHLAVVRWISCPHEDCKKVQQLLVAPD
jgi:hypothetical protein